MPRTVHNARIVFATVGSLGDLFPFLAVGQELRRRGHRVTIATHAVHQLPVEQAGLGFANASGMTEPEDREAFVAQAFHPWRGPRFVVHDVAALDVRASYDKLLPLCADADLLVTSTLAFAAQIIGEQAEAAGRLPWLSAVLAPAGFLSASDPPASGMRALDRFLRSSPQRGRWLSRIATRISHPWTAPVRALRRELGLPPQSPLGDPFHRGQHAPRGVLALFSPLFGRPQPDWPANVTLTGAARYPQVVVRDPALQAFLDDGPAPIVFTLGSAAVHANASFLRESARAAQQLGQRAVLLTGSAEMRARLPRDLPATIHCTDYAAHAELFPRAAVIVHHGGIGTSSEALRSGRPTLVVPHGFDQPDNAARLQRLGVAEILPARRYRADRAAQRLQPLLHDPDYVNNAARVALAMRDENGAARAADVIEAALRK
ncbi:glycosyltransferase [Rhodanobacter ginsengiterrae]|uniref:glycosyltransferase n=1 Tax=Rhodanobacter ginsengiterrae TaxID=2008451 RepID=UPI003CF2CB7D